MLFASAAQAQKRPSTKVVRCPTGGSGTQCVGTNARDHLLGRDGTYDRIQGRAGNGTYDGKGGGDAWEDSSSTSGDFYLVSVKDFNSVGISSLSIQDNGGTVDVLGLSRFYKSSDFAFSRPCTNFHMNGPGVNEIDIYNFFTTNSIDYFRFSDKTLTA